MKKNKKLLSRLKVLNKKLKKSLSTNKENVKTIRGLNKILERQPGLY